MGRLQREAQNEKKIIGDEKRWNDFSGEKKERCEIDHFRWRYKKGCKSQKTFFVRRKVLLGSRAQKIRVEVGCSGSKMRCLSRRMLAPSLTRTMVQNNQKSKCKLDHSIVCLHCSLICLLRTARFAAVLIHLLTRSLIHSLDFIQL